MSGTKVILNQDVYNLGEEGDVREVTRGYARNYLIPKKLAVPFNRENIAVFESRRDAIDKRKGDKRKEALGLKESLEGAVVVLTMTAGESGKLFGSVTGTMVSEELKKMGIQVEKKKIEVPSNTIKNVGEYTIRIKLYESEVAEVKLIVKDVHAKEETAAETAAEAPAAQEAVKDVLAESEIEPEEETADEEISEEEE
jgi:large subunit ribosomal protein L9